MQQFVSLNCSPDSLPAPTHSPLTWGFFGFSNQLWFASNFINAITGGISFIISNRRCGSTMALDQR